MGFLDGGVGRLREALVQAVDRVEDVGTPAALTVFVRPMAFRTRVFQATLGGRTCHVAPVFGRKGEGHQGMLIGAMVIAHGADVPLEIRVTGRRRSSDGLTRIELGDPSLENDLRLGATEPGLARAVLDDEAQRRLGATFAAAPRLHPRDLDLLLVERGNVAWFVPMREVGHLGGEPPSPADLREAVGWAFALADRVGRAFERARVEIASRGGPAAAAAWVEGQHAAVAGAKQARQQRALGVAFMTILAAVAIVVALVWSRSGAPDDGAHDPAPSRKAAPLPARSTHRR